MHHVGYLYITYQSFTYYVSVIYILRTSHLHITYKSFTYNVPVIYILRTSHLHITYQSFTSYVPVIYILRISHLHIRYQSFTHYVSVIFILRTSHLHITYQSFTYYVLVIYILRISHLHLTYQSFTYNVPVIYILRTSHLHITYQSFTYNVPVIYTLRTSHSCHISMKRWFFSTDFRKILECRTKLKVLRVGDPFVQWRKEEISKAGGRFSNFFFQKRLQTVGLRVKIFNFVKLHTHTLTHSLTHSLTYLLTPRCRFHLQKLTGLQLVNKFPAFYGTRMFITALTRARQLSLYISPGPRLS